VGRPQGRRHAARSLVRGVLLLCRRLAPTTQDTYRRDLDKYVLPRFGSYRMGQLPPNENWLNDELEAGIAPSTHEQYLIGGRCAPAPRPGGATHSLSSTAGGGGRTRLRDDQGVLLGRRVRTTSGSKGSWVVVPAETKPVSYVTPYARIGISEPALVILVRSEGGTPSAFIEQSAVAPTNQQDAGSSG